MTNNVEKKVDRMLKRAKLKKTIIIMIVVVCMWAIIILGIAVGDKSNNSSSEKIKEPQIVEINDVSFSVNNCTFFPTEEHYRKFVINVDVKNESEESILLDKYDFKIESSGCSDIYPLESYEDFFFYETLEKGETISLNLLFNVSEEVDLMDAHLEIDLSILSLGKNVYINKVHQILYSKSFEHYLCAINGIPESSIDLITELIAIEKIRFQDIVIIEDAEKLDEQGYLIIDGTYKYGLFLDKYGKSSLYDATYSKTLIIYENGIRNQNYLYGDFLLNEAKKIEDSIVYALEKQYYNSSVSNISYGRYVDKENAIVFQCYLKGYNEYGMELTKIYRCYLEWDFEKEQLIIFDQSLS